MVQCQLNLCTGTRENYGVGTAGPGSARAGIAAEALPSGCERRTRHNDGGRVRRRAGRGVTYPLRAVGTMAVLLRSDESRLTVPSGTLSAMITARRYRRSELVSFVSGAIYVGLWGKKLCVSVGDLSGYTVRTT